MTLAGRQLLKQNRSHMPLKPYTRRVPAQIAAAKSQAAHWHIGGLVLKGVLEEAGCLVSERPF
jgi:hypothetical protein